MEGNREMMEIDIKTLTGIGRESDVLGGTKERQRKVGLRRGAV